MLCCFHCCAQSFPNLKFSHLTEKEGLSNNTVRSIAQDAQGFLWFGTDNGLNRFDGYRIKQFHHQPSDINSLANQVLNVEPDKKNNLWVSTEEGLSFFKRQKNEFINFKHKDDDTSSLKTDNNNALLTDEQNNEWVTTSAGLYRFNAQLHYTYIQLDAQSRFAKKTQLQIFGLYVDVQKKYWAYAQNYLFRLNKDKVAIDTFASPAGFIVTFYQDKKGNYWAGTFQNGLYRFNSTTGKFTQVSPVSKSITIFSIAEWRDKNNFSWLAIGADNGLILLDPVTQKSFQYMHDALNNFSVSGNEVYKVYTDKQNILWLATNKGVSYIEPSKQLIETWRIPAEQKNNYTEDAGYMYSFFEDDSSYLMTNWSHVGLYEFDKNGLLIKIIPTLYPQGSDSLRNSASQAFSIVKDKQKNYWFSVNAGLVQFNMQHHTYQLYQPPGNDLLAGFRNIAVLNDTAWFIRTRNNGGNGIYVFNPEQKKFTAHYYIVCCKNCLPANLMAMIVTKKGEIFTTPRNNRLYQYDAKTNSFVASVINNLNANISSTFDCFAEDKQGNIWIGMANGLIQYNPLSKNIIHDFTTHPMLGGVAIQQICIDDDENIWMSTESGLYCLLHNRKNIFNFNAGDGLPNNSLLGFLTKGKDGNIYCGAEGYVIKFNPKKLLQNTSAGIKTFFSEAGTENKNIPFNISSDNNKKITLTPHQNIFSVDFAVLNFDNAESNRYYYKLDGAMKEWKENENGHLTFYNLPAGKYTLHVQGGNKYGERFAGEDELMIEVQPHWWQTTWFILLLVVVVVASTIMLIRRRFQQVKKAAELKQKIAETEMIALRAQMNPHFIFNCLSSIDNLIQTNEKEKATTYLARFAKLIRAILENSKTNSIPCWKDLETLKLYVELEELRWDKKISYQLNIAPEILQGDYKVPPMIIQPYVENAIHHGLLNKEYGSRQLLIDVKAENNCINYLIEDNGIGRKKAIEYKLLNKLNHQSMGLDITSKRINLFNQNNNGNITITDLYNENSEAAGTRVTISLIN
ncbi:MAG: ligand-binding sensor domain-containing protein [Chitinophagaceae bacterium]